MSHQGGCHCGAVRYEVTGEPVYAALCHCSDCRRSAGAPAVAWAAFKDAQFTLLSGDATLFNSSGASHRYFCPTCGTGVYFRNAENLPGLVDIQQATLDDPEALSPKVNIQTADRLHWMETAHQLPAFERYPSG
jgi:hypothetical protein